MCSWRPSWIYANCRSCPKSGNQARFVLEHFFPQISKKNFIVLNISRFWKFQMDYIYIVQKIIESITHFLKWPQAVTQKKTANIFQYSRPALSCHLFKTFFLSIIEWLLKTSLNVRVVSQFLPVCKVRETKAYRIRSVVLNTARCANCSKVNTITTRLFILVPQGR